MIEYKFLQSIIIDSTFLHLKVNIKNFKQIVMIIYRK